jgi:hypothetical protein
MGFLALVLLSCVISVTLFTKPLATVALEAEIRQVFPGQAVKIQTMTGSFPTDFDLPEVQVGGVRLQHVDIQYQGSWNPFTFLTHQGNMVHVLIQKITNDFLSLSNVTVELKRKPQGYTVSALLWPFNTAVRLEVDTPDFQSIVHGVANVGNWTLEYEGGTRLKMFSQGKHWFDVHVEPKNSSTWSVTVHVPGFIDLRTNVRIKENGGGRLFNHSMTIGHRTHGTMTQLEVDPSPSGVRITGERLQYVLNRTNFVGTVMGKPFNFLLDMDNKSIVSEKPIPIYSSLQHSPFRGIDWRNGEITIRLGQYPIIVTGYSIRVGPIVMTFGTESLHLMVQGGHILHYECAFLNATLDWDTPDLLRIHSTHGTLNGERLAGKGTFNLTDHDLKLNFDVDIMTG